MSNPPLISPVFQIDGNVLQYKPHVDYPDWIDIWNLSGIIPTVPTLVYPDCAYLVPSMFRTIVTGFATPTLQAGQWTYAYSLLNGNLATADCQIVLDANDYAYSLGYVKSSAGGKLGIYVDTVKKDEIDTYNATTQLAQHVDNTLIDGLGAGLHTIRFRVDGHNNSSSAFQCLVSYMAIRRKP